MHESDSSGATDATPLPGSGRRGGARLGATPLASVGVETGRVYLDPFTLPPGMGMLDATPSIVVDDPRRAPTLRTRLEGANLGNGGDVALVTPMPGLTVGGRTERLYWTDAASEPPPPVRFHPPVTWDPDCTAMARALSRNSSVGPRGPLGLETSLRAAKAPAPVPRVPLPFAPTPELADTRALGAKPKAHVRGTSTRRQQWATLAVAGLALVTTAVSLVWGRRARLRGSGVEPGSTPPPANTTSTTSGGGTESTDLPLDDPSRALIPAPVEPLVPPQQAILEREGTSAKARDRISVLGAEPAAHERLDAVRGAGLGSKAGAARTHVSSERTPTAPSHSTGGAAKPPATPSKPHRRGPINE